MGEEREEGPGEGRRKKLTFSVLLCEFVARGVGLAGSFGVWHFDDFRVICAENW